MDIRTYAGFAAVADLSSVTLAADRLHLTQSALSRQIMALEESFGLKLFEKAGRNLSLTPAGEALARSTPLGAPFDCDGRVGHVVAPRPAGPRPSIA